MIIVLIILLTIISISLSISMAGLEFSYQVGKRVQSLKKKMKEQDDENNTKEKSSIDKLSPYINAAKRGAKKVLKLLKVIIVSLRNLLSFVLGFVVIIDIILFIIIVASVGAYLLLFNQQG